MTTLAEAIREERWELAAYLLAVAVLRVGDAVPPETLEAVVDLLSEGGDGWTE